MARRLGCEVLEIRVALLHGRCLCEAPDTPRGHALLAWGGALAQLAVAAPMIALAQVDAIASRSHLAIVLVAFGYFSLLMAALNLAPARGLDGATAWRLVPILWRDLRARAAAKKATRELLRRLK